MLPVAYLVGTVCTEALLKTDLACRDYVDEAKSYQLSLARVLPDVGVSDRVLPRKSYAGTVGSNFSTFVPTMCIHEYFACVFISRQLFIYCTYLFLSFTKLLKFRFCLYLHFINMLHCVICFFKPVYQSLS